MRFIYRSHQYARYISENRTEYFLPPELTIHDYLLSNNYSLAFIEDSLYSMMTALCTCPYEDCRNYPAFIVLEFFGRGLIFEGANVVTAGVQQVCKVMSKNIKNIYFKKAIVSIDNINVDGETKVEVVDQQGNVEIFDSVIIASQANQALAMLKNPTNEEVISFSFFFFLF